jgi:hypothetical protein
MNYVPTGGGNYDLASSSPAIDQGAGEAAPARDQQGGSRPVGSGFDVGAYEFGSRSAAWPWF